MALGDVQIDLSRQRLITSEGPISEFLRLSGAASELILTMKKQPYRPNPAKKLEQASLYATWRDSHVDELAEYVNERAEATQGKNAAYAAKHRAKLLNAVPSWADLSAVESIYAEAAAAGMHVDHIYPLRGESVCGLHVANNLRCLTLSENLRKGNAMPEQVFPSSA